MHAEIVMIGTELLLGELVDTNANRLARTLREIGMDLYYKTTVGDNLTRITEVLSLALDRSDVVITSGGIGPTADDVTRQAVANATDRRLTVLNSKPKSLTVFGGLGDRWPITTSAKPTFPRTHCRWLTPPVQRLAF